MNINNFSSLGRILFYCFNKIENENWIVRTSTVVIFLSLFPWMALSWCCSQFHLLTSGQLHHKSKQRTWKVSSRKNTLWILIRQEVDKCSKFLQFHSISSHLEDEFHSQRILRTDLVKSSRSGFRAKAVPPTR